MIRRLTLACALGMLLVAPAAQAQLGSMVPHFGFKAGLNFSDINVDDVDASNRTGWGAGFYADLASPLLHLQPEVLFMAKGFKDATLTTDHRFDARRYGVEIPVLVVLDLPMPMIRPRAFIGPALTIPLKSEINIGGTWYDINNDSKTSWSLVVGAGATLLNKVGLELRYDIGLSELNKRPLDQIVEDVNDEFASQERTPDLKDRTFSVMASIAFN